jgi:acyl-CoA thioesterase
MTFEDDTALAELGERRWSAAVDERWWVMRGPFGGFVTALLTRALLAVTEHPPRTLAVHFLDAPRAGAVEISAEVERRGRSTDAVSLRLEQDGAVMALALANAGDRRDAPAWSGLEPPDAPPPEDCNRVEPPVVPFIGQLDVRWVDGSPWGEAQAPWNRAWIADPSGAQLDAVFVGALADVWMPPAFQALGGQAVVPTLDLTVHWREPVPPGTRWLLAEHRAAHAGGGTWTCDGVLWAPDGTVLAQSRQCALLRTT